MRTEKRPVGRRGGSQKARPGRTPIKGTAVRRLRAWKLEDAKARFSEVVRRARDEGPQRVTYRGKDAVVVIAVEELRKLLPAARPAQPLVDFLQGTALAEIDIEHAPDRGRDVAL